MKVARTPSRTFRRHAIAVAVLSMAAFGAAVPAGAQSWWPFGNDEPRRPPVPSEPMNRPAPQPFPAPVPQPAPQAYPPSQTYPPTQAYPNQAYPNQAYPNQAPPPNQGHANWSTKNPICLQLEQRLVQEGQKGTLSASRLPQIESELRTVDRAFNVGASKLDSSCYEFFLFTKSFRNTPQCKELARQVDVSKRRLGELEAQRQEAMGSAGRSYKDDIIRELARNNCGANYVDQARRRDGGFWQDEETLGNSTWTPHGGTSGVATYRTLCVRLCDGYYFPVSFSTLPSHFPQDAEACSSRCAAPTELYYYPNPGGAVDQSVALTSQEPYTKMRTAFRYRKEFVNGCSCKEAEYVPEGSTPDKKADSGATAPKTSATPPRRADAATGTDHALTTGSTSVPATEGEEPAPAAAPSESAPATDPEAAASSGWETETQPQ